MATKRATSVPKNFEDQLAAFVTRAKADGWDQRYGLDVKTLDNDLKLQRRDKDKHAELKLAFEKFHVALAGDQSDRYQRFMTSLEIVRAAYRNDPDTLKSLAPFKRNQGNRSGRKSKSG
jgi:hypothetical protein